MLNRFYFFEWRQAKGISQREMARRMDIHYSVLSRIEAGKRDWNGQFLAKFSEIIGCKVCDPLCKKPNQESLDSLIDEQDEALRPHFRNQARLLLEQLRDAIAHGRSIAIGETPDDEDQGSES